MTKSRNVVTSAVVTSAAACLVALVAVAAPTLTADAATTAVSFTLSSGYLTVTQNDGTAPGAAADGAGQVVVHDSRGGTLGWAVTGVSTAVRASGGAMAVSYASGPVTTAGSVTATSQGSTELGSTPAVLVIGTDVTGYNTATWTPTVTVLGPPAASAATAVTYSVL